MSKIITIHSALSPSAADRWLNCTGSVQATGSGDGGGSQYAEEGTAAHTLLELCLRFSCAPEELKGVKLHEGMEFKGEKGKVYHVDDDMIDAVGHAYDYIMAHLQKYPKTYVGVEQRVWWGKEYGLSEEVSSGTCDVMLSWNNGKRSFLTVIDYKHGAGKLVEVDANPQLKLYAVGALDKTESLSPDVNIVIVQPRARHEDGPVRTSVEKTEALRTWMKKVVLPAAKQALERNAPRTAGAWCRWCSAAPTCRALIDHVMKEAGTEFDAQPLPAPKDPMKLSRAELARAMQASEMIEGWIKAVRGRALDMMLKGQELPGWKLVLGRTTRQYKEGVAPDVVKICHKLFDNPNDYAPRMLLSVAQLEKKVKRAKKDFKKLFGKFVGHSDPPVHTAPEHDERPAYRPGSEFDPLA